jgi:glycosyltransferase involved in cell wall biosynthesis
MSEPTFTVIMAARDTENTISSAVRSVLAQTRGDFELIVIDDGSSDATPDRVRSFSDPRIRLISQERAGAASARGTAIAAGTAPLVSLIDSDDLWMPRYLEAMGAALEADPGAGFAYTDAWYLDERSRHARRVSAMGYQRPPEPPPASPTDLFAALLDRNFMFNAVTVRRSAIETAGPPDVRLRSMIDWEWWLRLAATGHRAVRAPGRLAVYRQRPASISKDPSLVIAGQRELWRVVGTEYDLPDETRRELAARAERFDAELAAMRGQRPVAGVLWRLRRRAAAVKAALRHRRDFHREPPNELREAFGDLRSV